MEKMVRYFFWSLLFVAPQVAQGMSFISAGSDAALTQPASDDSADELTRELQQARYARNKKKFLIASYFGLSDVVARLVCEGVDANACEADGRTALMYAANRNDLPMAILLIENGANPLAADDKGRTPLMYAAKAGAVAVQEYLFGLGAEVNGQDHAGKTALMQACKYGHLDSARSLVNHHADVAILSHEGRSAPRYALKNGHTAVVDFFHYFLVNRSRLASLLVVEELGIQRDSDFPPEIAWGMVRDLLSSVIHSELRF